MQLGYKQLHVIVSYLKSGTLYLVYSITKICMIKKFAVLTPELGIWKIYFNENIDLLSYVEVELCSVVRAIEILTTLLVYTRN